MPRLAATIAPAAKPKARKSKSSEDQKVVVKSFQGQAERLSSLVFVSSPLAHEYPHPIPKYTHISSPFTQQTASIEFPQPAVLPAEDINIKNSTNPYRPGPPPGRFLSNLDLTIRWGFDLGWPGSLHLPWLTAGRVQRGVSMAATLRERSTPYKVGYLARSLA